MKKINRFLDNYVTIINNIACVVAGIATGYLFPRHITLDTPWELWLKPLGTSLIVFVISYFLVVIPLALPAIITMIGQFIHYLIHGNKKD